MKNWNMIGFVIFTCFKFSSHSFLANQLYILNFLNFPLSESWFYTWFAHQSSADGSYCAYHVHSKIFLDFPTPLFWLTMLWYRYYQEYNLQTHLLSSIAWFSKMCYTYSLGYKAGCEQIFSCLSAFLFIHLSIWTWFLISNSWFVWRMTLNLVFICFAIWFLRLHWLCNCNILWLGHGHLISEAIQTL